METATTATADTQTLKAGADVSSKLQPVDRPQCHMRYQHCKTQMTGGNDSDVDGLCRSHCLPCAISSDKGCESSTTARGNPEGAKGKG